MYRWWVLALDVSMIASGMHGCGDPVIDPIVPAAVADARGGDGIGAGEVTAASYFPLHVGDRWVYELGGPTKDGARQGRGSETVEVTVTDSHTEGGRQVFHLDSYLFPISSREIQFFDEAPGRIVELTDRGTGLWYPWSGFPGGELLVAIPELGPDCIHGSAGVCRGLGSVTVPAGTFESAATIDYLSNPCGDRGLAREVLAPGVGLIERTVNTIAGEAIWSLVHANVDGRTWGTPPPP